MGKEIFRFYRDNSIAVWNGTPMAGSSAISEFYKKMPTTKHLIDSIDCHPIQLGNDASKTMLVTVVGKVIYAGADKMRPFNQNFILSQEEGGGRNYYVASDCFRLVS
eukprot:TRINITY_DN237_c0_g1_i2.p1 TRINITY_DN237_c0_g1~~TRINITY_DN237_c0_g1_i2.p1  ORF type:complete len:107 (+),score=29.03 TRINITY_DN237_c0_g1_i2:490-810(+)